MAEKDDEIEMVSEYLHDLWSKWYMHQRDNSTPENIKRWEDQCKMRYEHLSEEDKDKDRKLAQKLLRLLS